MLLSFESFRHLSLLRPLSKHLCVLSNQPAVAFSEYYSIEAFARDHHPTNPRPDALKDTLPATTNTSPVAVRKCEKAERKRLFA